MMINNCVNANTTSEPFIVMYHGVLTNGRGIESLIRLVAINPNIYGVILGNGDERYTKSLKKMVKDEGVNSRILFHPAVSITDLWKYVGAADVSLMMIEATAKSYYYALPNKFFESIQALTPIISSDFPEMKRIIDKYEIGLTCNPNDINEINGCVERMRIDKDFYYKCKNNLKKAKKDLCWEREKQVLIDALKIHIGKRE